MHFSTGKDLSIWDFVLSFKVEDFLRLTMERSLLKAELVLLVGLKNTRKSRVLSHAESLLNGLKTCNKKRVHR